MNITPPKTSVNIATGSNETVYFESPDINIVPRLDLSKTTDFTVSEAPKEVGSCVDLVLTRHQNPYINELGKKITNLVHKNLAVRFKNTFQINDICLKKHNLKINFQIAEMRFRESFYVSDRKEFISINNKLRKLFSKSDSFQLKHEKTLDNEHFFSITIPLFDTKKLFKAFKNPNRGSWSIKNLCEKIFNLVEKIFNKVKCKRVVDFSQSSTNLDLNADYQKGLETLNNALSGYVR